MSIAQQVPSGTFELLFISPGHLTFSYHLFISPVHITCSSHLFISPIYLTCSYHSLISPVYLICSYHLFISPVLITCLSHLFMSPVYLTCSYHLFSTPVQVTCSTIQLTYSSHFHFLNFQPYISIFYFQFLWLPAPAENLLAVCLVLPVVTEMTVTFLPSSPLHVLSFAIPPDDQDITIMI